MKRTTIIISLLGLTACNNRPDISAVKEQSKSAQVDSLNIDLNEIIGSGGQAYNEFQDCNFDEFIKDNKTPKLAKDIYLNNEWNLGNDNEALALLDSLNAKNKDSKPFYFKVVSLTIKKSDGYFSEGLGLIGKEFIENNTIEFVNNFSNKECFTKDDLNNWADIVMLELGMFVEEMATNNVVEEYINTLQVNCRNCNPKQKETLKIFVQLLLNKKDKLLLEIKNNKNQNH